MSEVILTIKDMKEFFLDKANIEQVIAEQNRRMQFVPDVNATPQKSRAMMIASGINPEDNLGSYGIISARDET